MRTLKKERLSQLVTDAIKEIIEEEHLKPGDRLYSENQLAQKLDVSRSSVREAIRILEVTGLVRAQQGKGIFITEGPDESNKIKKWVVDNTELLGEHFEVRLLIEPHAAAKAAMLADEKDIAALEEVYRDFCGYLRAGEVIKAIRSDSKFHLLLAKFSRNRTLSVLMKTMAQSLNEGWIASLNTPGRLESTVIEHKEVIEAVKLHDAQRASDLMASHLRQALHDIRAYTESF